MENLLDLLMDHIKPQVQTLHLVYRDDESFALELCHHDGRHEMVRVTMKDILQWVTETTKTKIKRRRVLAPTKTVPELVHLLVQEYPVLEEVWPRINIVGDVQSGKSRFMMAALWTLTYHHGLECILVLMNMVESYNQVLLRDVVLFNQWLREQGGENYLLQVEGLRGRGGGCTQEKSIRLCMGNAAQLTKLVSQGGPVAVVCDEADTLVKHWDASQDSTKSGALFQSCIAKAKSVWCVTATPFALLNQLEVESKSWRLPISTLYRGTQHFKVHPLDKETTETLRNDDKALASFVEKVCVEQSVRDQLPYLAILVNARWTQAAQKKFAQTLRGRVSYILNSESPCFIKRCDEEGNLHGTPFKTVSELFDSLEAMGGYQEHILIANRTANRAVSFRPSPLVGHGGLTVEIFLPPETTHCASLRQALRLSGNYDPEYPDLHLYISESAWLRILGEEKNMTLWVDKNREWGVPREQITGTMFQSVGLHDRTAVDDTTLEQRYKLCHHDFESREALESMIPPFLQPLPRVWMTQENPTVLTCPANFVYTTNRVEQGRWHQQLKEGLDGRVQICWNEPRYRQLHDLKQRFGNKRRQYLCSYLVGDGVETEPLYRVAWKPEFCEDELTMDDSRWKDAVYLYRTSRGAFRFYHASCESVSMGQVAHGPHA